MAGIVAKESKVSGVFVWRTITANTISFRDKGLKCADFDWDQGGLVGKCRQRCARSTGLWPVGDRFDVCRNGSCNVSINNELLFAASTGTPDTIGELIRSGAELNYCDPDCGNSALYNAVISDRKDNAERLLSLGADPKAKN